MAVRRKKLQKNFTKSYNQKLQPKVSKTNEKQDRLAKKNTYKYNNARAWLLPHIDVTMGLILKMIMMIGPNKNQTSRPVCKKYSAGWVDGCKSRFKDCSV